MNILPALGCILTTTRPLSVLSAPSPRPPPRWAIHRLGKFFGWQYYDGFVPDCVVIGKMMQCASLLTMVPAAAQRRDRFVVFPDGPPTTTWMGVRAVRLAVLLRFLQGKVALLEKPSLSPTSPPQFFHLTKDMGDFHSVCKTVLEKHWGESDLKDGTIWGSGMFWFFKESRYLEHVRNNVLMAALDVEQVVRLIIPLRPVHRLQPALESMFPPTDSGGKKRSRSASSSAGASGAGGASSSQRQTRQNSAQQAAARVALPSTGNELEVTIS